MPTIETKALMPEANTAFDDFNRVFSAFRETNDDRLSQIEARASSDVVTEEKLNRIEDALDRSRQRMDRITLAMSRPGQAANSEADPTRREHKNAFDLYARSGEASGLKSLESKAMSAGSGPDGGYLVPQPAEQEILRRMSVMSPIRAIASVREISGPSLRKAFSMSGPAAGWVAEADPRPQSANQQIADMTFPAMELYAMPAATQT